jgi:hypothetical protein
MGRCQRRDRRFLPNKNTCPRRNRSEAQLVREGLLEQAADKQQFNHVKTEQRSKGIREDTQDKAHGLLRLSASGAVMTEELGKPGRGHLVLDWVSENCHDRLKAAHTWKGLDDNFGVIGRGFLRVYKTARYAYSGCRCTNGYSVAHL